MSQRYFVLKTARWGACCRAIYSVLMMALCACGGRDGPINNVSSNANTVADAPDPTTFAIQANAVNFVALADRDTCLRPIRGAASEAADAVGTGPCTGDANDRFRINADGTLGFGDVFCLSADGNVPAAAQGLILASCSAATAQQVVLMSGRLWLGGVGSLQVAQGLDEPNADGFVQAVLAAPAATDSLQGLWQVGLASAGASGDSNVVVAGFPITLVASQDMCLTGRDTVVGVLACTASASQTWIINETGGLQLGAYCLSATTSGTISQGTPSKFALCRKEDPGQDWQVQNGVLSLQNLFLAPTTVPPPAAGFTPTALVTSAVQWRLGG